MDSEVNLPSPIRFSPFKHHRNYILGMLMGNDSNLIINLLDSLCNNYIDIYTGMMMPEDIGKEVISILKINGTFLSDDFNRWVSVKKGYQKIKLVDQSEWIIRKSNETERYIHIHPARSGSHTVRYKGSTLKTIYQLKISSAGCQESVSLEKVNLIRIQVGLSPIKKLERNKGILKCYEKFFDQDFK